MLPVCDTPVTRAPACPPAVRVIVRPLRSVSASSPDCRFGYAEDRQPGRFALPCPSLSPLLNHAWETVQGVSAPVSVLLLLPLSPCIGRPSSPARCPLVCALVRCTLHGPSREWYTMPPAVRPGLYFAASLLRCSLFHGECQFQWVAQRSLAAVSGSPTCNPSAYISPCMIIV